LIVLKRQVKRAQLSWRERGMMGLLASQLRGWKEALFIAQPDTLLRWHRDWFRGVWRRKSPAKEQGGRRPLSGRVVQLIRRRARENPLWGAARIRGELLKQQIGVAKSSIQKYSQGIQKKGASGQTWSAFLRNHASEVWACASCRRLMRSFEVFLCS
jgi:hypothetical protein